MEAILSDSIVMEYQKKFYKGAPANTFEPLAETERREIEGVTLVNEICYDERYPNSFADLYHCGDQKAPTLVYLHGGGWFMGSRTSGDPLASAGGSIAKQNIFIAKQGFNVVSMDYCLAPEYRFPAQLIQVSEGLRFFSDHAEEFGLNMKKIVIFGGSAGAVLTAQLGLVYSNPDYAGMTGTEPLISPDAICGLAIDGAPMNMALVDEGVTWMAKTWLGTNDFVEKHHKIIHVCESVSSAYPPVFLTAGNEGCFMAHTKELGEVLREAGVPVDEYYPDPAISKEGHGYMNNMDVSAQAREGMERQIAFMKKVTV